MRRFTLLVLSHLIIVTLGVGCAPTPRVASIQPMSKPDTQLLGNWQKMSDSSCSQAYPDAIQFQENGLYVGRTDQPDRFTLWDVGTFEVVDPKHINISTANDAIVTYAFSVSKDILTFTDPEGCKFGYRHVR